MKKKILKIAARIFPAVISEMGCQSDDINGIAQVTVDLAEALVDEVGCRYPVDEVFDADLKEHVPERVFMTGDKVYYRGTLCIVKKGFDDVVPPNKPYAIHIAPCNEDDDIGRGKGRGGWTHSSNSRLYAVVTGVNCTPEASDKCLPLDFSEKPKGMTIQEAILHSEKTGLGMTRIEFDEKEDCFIAYRNEDGFFCKLMGSMNRYPIRYPFSIDDILADDWVPVD